MLKLCAAALAGLLTTSAVQTQPHDRGRTTTIAANGTAIAVDTAPVAAGEVSRMEHRASPQATISELRLIDANWYYGGDMRPQNGPQRRVRAWLEYPEGTLHPVRWSTGEVLELGAGENAVSLPVAVSIPRGARFWTRWMNAGAAVSRWPVQLLPAPPAAIGRTDGNARSGERNIPIARNDTAFFGPAAILGTVWRRDARGAVIVGDSIAFGVGDVSSTGSAGGSGYLARAIDPLFAYTKLARGGQRAADVAGSDADAPRRFIALLSYSDVFFEHGVNDLRLGSSPAQILRDQRTIRARFRNSARKWQMTLTPRTLSSDIYRSAAGQTPKTDGTMPLLATINRAIRAKHGRTLRIVDTADAAMTARNSGIWSGPWPPVLDGTHPTSAKAAALAEAVRPALAAPR